MNTLPEQSHDRHRLRHHPVPDPPAGTVLRLRKEDWRYGGHPLSLRVEQVRHDISHYYRDEWLWIVGEALDSDGIPSGRIEALVRVAALTEWC